ncbi:MAG: GGDEF domain-containing protein [Deltaproteobacteria bacterium]
MSRHAASVNQAGSPVPASILNMDYLVHELDYHRKKAQRLAVINELHGRLAGATDLAGMIEALSVWLLPLVEHDLIAYNNPLRNRQYLFCSCHGPKRRQVVEIARKVFAGGISAEYTTADNQPYHVQQWRLQGQRQQATTIVLVRKGEMKREELHLINDALLILREPLRRALEYEDLFEMANNDALTGLANRRVFEDCIDAMLEGAKRHNRPLSLASMDLDHFKQINDNFGHAEGDRVLQLVAKVMKKTIRRSDLLARMGGDEFLLVLPDTALKSAQALTERLCRAIRRLKINVPDGRQLGISIGLLQYRPGMERDELLAKADEILYQAKSLGRARVCVGN